MSLKDAINLCDYYTKSCDPKMKWMWGEGLFGYALSNLDEYLQEDRYLPFLKNYCDYWYDHRPKIESSDTSAPGLITYYTYKKLHDEKYKELTDSVLYYMKNEPRTEEGLVNHMGHNDTSKWYPASIWVDSLMMFGVFASLYGKENNDKELLEMAKKQTILFAKYLQDKEWRLWYHSYWFNEETHYPISKIFWGRGNAWVISAIPKILDNLDECEEKEEIKNILKSSAIAITEFQHKDGSFSTILGTWGVYKELSATALIADGLLHAVRMGYLDEKYKEKAIKAYDWCTKNLKYKRNKVLLRKISFPTIPLMRIPFLGYACMPRKANWSYGMAAYVYASIEYERTIKNE